MRDALIVKGHDANELPSIRTMRDILNRMNYRLKRIQKGKPSKKTKDTDAIFANLRAVRKEVDGYQSESPDRRLCLGGKKTRTNAAGKVAEKGWDHDPPAKEKSVPFGILVLLSGALTLIFCNQEASDMVLILDTANYKYPFIWVKVDAMWKAMTAGGRYRVKKIERVYDRFSKANQVACPCQASD